MLAPDFSKLPGFQRKEEVIEGRRVVPPEPDLSDPPGFQRKRDISGGSDGGARFVQVHVESALDEVVAPNAQGAGEDEGEEDQHCC